jgi:hypothetical protein
LAVGAGGGVVGEGHGALGAGAVLFEFEEVAEAGGAEEGGVGVGGGAGGTGGGVAEVEEGMEKRCKNHSTELYQIQPICSQNAWVWAQNHMKNHEI